MRLKTREGGGGNFYTALRRGPSVPSRAVSPQPQLFTSPLPCYKARAIPAKGPLSPHLPLRAPRHVIGSSPPLIDKCPSSTAHARYRRGTPCCRLLNKIRYCRRCSAQARWCRGSQAAHGRQNRAAGTLGGVGAAGTAQKRHETGRKCTSGHCYGGRTPLRCVPPLTCMQRSNGKPRFPQCPGTWRCRRAARVGTGGAHTCIRACRQRKALGAPYGAPQPPWEPPGAAQGCACPAARGAGNPVGSPRECYGMLQGHRGSLGSLTRTLGRLWGTLRDRRTPTNLSALQQNEWKSSEPARTSATE